MRLSPFLVPAMALIALCVRALPRPTYLGVTADEAATTRLGLAAPFGDDLKGSSDAFLALQAASLVREGFAATGGIPLFNVDKSERADFAYYDHHPPGVAIVTALAFRLFGASELVARGVALLFATVTLAVAAGCVRRCCGDGPAIAAALGATLPPMGWYWATHLDYQVPTIAMAALFMERALREAPARSDRWIAGLALVAALAFDFLGVLALLAVVVVRAGSLRSSWRALAGWTALAGATGIVLVLWKTLQGLRHGHAGGRLVDHVAAVWALPPGVGPGRFLGAIGAHLHDLAGGVALAAVAAALALAWSRRIPAELRRFLLAASLFAALAGTLPRMRAFDHPYFQLDWQLPVALACGLLAHRLSGGGAAAAPRARRIAVVATMALLLGFDGGRLELARMRLSAGSELLDRPASHRLGAELAARVPASVRAIALPASSSFNDFVPSWYAGRVVRRLPAGQETRAGFEPTLAFLGLRGAEAWLALDPQWPGRGGFEPLR